jgi:hypothetical protein
MGILYYGYINKSMSIFLRLKIVSLDLLFTYFKNKTFYFLTFPLCKKFTYIKYLILCLPSYVAYIFTVHCLLWTNLLMFYSVFLHPNQNTK